MKRFIGSLFVLSLALAALVSNESKASSFIMPGYGSGYGSHSPISYGSSSYGAISVKVTVGFPTYGGYNGFGAGCFTGCGAYRPYPYYPVAMPYYPPYYGGGRHGYGGGGGGWGFGFRIGRFSFRFASWGRGYKPNRHGHMAHHRHFPRYNGMYY